MHGNGRTAESYISKFTSWNRGSGFVVIAPHFPKPEFSNNAYNLGDVSRLGSENNNYHR
eukprot:Awhi_evm1s12282